MADGTIKKIVSDRGFGFIAGADDSEYFFHRDGVDIIVPRRTRGVEPPVYQSIHIRSLQAGFCGQDRRPAHVVG